MKLNRRLTAAAGVVALALSGLLVTAPAQADEGGIRELPLDVGSPLLPGLAPSFDTVTVVDAQTGKIVGTRPNREGRGVSIIGGPVTIVTVTRF